jgi:plastocyanin
VVALLLVALCPTLACTGAADRGIVARKHVIAIEAFEYKPASLRVAPGDTVVWSNRDFVPHTATAESRKWDTGTIDAGAAGTVVPNTAGDHTYFCILHPTMKATLTVIAEKEP